MHQDHCHAFCLLPGEEVFEGDPPDLFLPCPGSTQMGRYALPSFVNIHHGFFSKDLRLTGQLIVYYNESWSMMLYRAERCAVRHDRETRRLEGNRRFVFPPLHFSIRHIDYMRYNKSLFKQTWLSIVSNYNLQEILSLTSSMVPLKYDTSRVCQRNIAETRFNSGQPHSLSSILNIMPLHQSSTPCPVPYIMS